MSDVIAVALLVIVVAGYCVYLNYHLNKQMKKDYAITMLSCLMWYYFSKFIKTRDRRYLDAGQFYDIISAMYVDDN